MHETGVTKRRVHIVFQDEATRCVINDFQHVLLYVKQWVLICYLIESLYYDRAEQVNIVITVQVDQRHSLRRILILDFIIWDCGSDTFSWCFMNSNSA